MLANVRIPEWLARAGLAIASGILYFAAYPGLGAWPLAFVALAPLVVAVEECGFGGALVLGWVAGVTANLLGFRWMYGASMAFTGASPFACAVFLVALCAWQGGRLGAMALLASAARACGWTSWVAWPAALAVSELTWPVLFPWYLAGAVHDWTSLRQAAELGGPCLVSVLTFLPSLAIAELAISYGARRSVNWAAVAVTTTTPFLAVGWGAWRVRAVDAYAENGASFRAAIVQADTPPDALEPREAVATRYLDATRSLKSDFVVWSELAVSTPNASRWLQRLRNRTPAPVVVGASIADVQGGRVRVFNSALVTDARGEVAGRYDKHVLFPFGEYVPFAERAPFIAALLPHAGKFNPGAELGALRIDGHPIATSICYEDVLPRFVNELVQAVRPELLVNLSSDAWFGDTAEPWIHLALAQFRAVEHRLYLLRAAGTGVSAVIDPAGRVVAHTGVLTREVLEATGHWLRPAPTIYEQIGELPWWLLAGVLATHIVMRSLARLVRAEGAGGVACRRGDQN